MQIRHPAVVIDETIANLDYLTEFLLDDIDHGSIRDGEARPSTLKAIAALEAVRVLLPRLRVVRSNYVANSRFPDGPTGADLLTPPESTDDAGEASTTTGHARIIR